MFNRVLAVVGDTQNIRDNVSYILMELFLSRTVCLMNSSRSWKEKPEIINAEALLEATRETGCSYIVLSENRRIDSDLTEYGLELVAVVGGYNIYADSVVINS